MHFSGSFNGQTLHILSCGSLSADCGLQETTFVFFLRMSLSIGMWQRDLLPHAEDLG